MNILNDIFEWVLEAGLRASLLVPIVLGAQWLLRMHLPATWRYALWLPVLVALLVPALPILPSSLAQRLSPPATTTVGNSPTAQPSAERSLSVDREISGFTASSTGRSGRVDSPAMAGTNPPAPVNWPAIALFAWLAGAVATGLSIHASFVVTMRRVKRTALPVHPDLLARVAHLAAAAGLRRVPRLRRSRAVSSPSVCGLWRPTLLINERFEQDWSEEEMELILRHELAHVRRGDLPINALQCALLAVHWFNPLLWLAFFRARADREAACDEAVLRGEPAPRRAAYGHALLKMETSFPPSGLCLGFVGILQSRGTLRTLRTRIQSIIAQRKLNVPSAAAVAAGIAVLALLGITGVGAQSEVAQPQPDPEYDKAAVHPLGGDDGFMVRQGEGECQKIEDRQIPSRAVSGKLNDARFVAERIGLEDGRLRFQMGEDFNMQYFEIQIPADPKDLGNKTFIATPRKRLEGCEVDFLWPFKSTIHSPRARGKTMFGNFSLKLEFGAVTDRKLPGRVYLSIEKDKSHIEGGFEVRLD